MQTEKPSTFDAILNDLEETYNLVKEMIEAGESREKVLAGIKKDPSRDISTIKKGLILASDLIFEIARSFQKIEDYGTSREFLDLYRTVLDIITNFTPGISTSKDLYILATGKNYVTGEKVSEFEQAISAASILLPGWLKVASKVWNRIQILKTIAESSKSQQLRKLAKNLSESLSKLNKLAGTAGKALVKTRDGRIALDANVLIGALDKGQLATIEKALNGRVPVISITAAKEYLRKGDIEVLRKFLSTKSGSVGKATSKELIHSLKKQAELLGRVLKSKDAAVAGSAIGEQIPLITSDKRLFNFMIEAGYKAELLLYGSL